MMYMSKWQLLPSHIYLNFENFFGDQNVGNRGQAMSIYIVKNGLKGISLGTLAPDALIYLFILL